MRFLAICTAVLLTNCTPAPKPAESARDETKEPWYGETVGQLAAMNREAESLFQKGNGDQAAELIERGEPLKKRLLAVPRPTFEAAEDASDLDQLYGRMLFSNHHYGWARMLFQQDLARWKYWRPQTPETGRLLKRAEDAIIECDQHLD